MRPRTAFLTILLAAVLATTVIGVGAHVTQAGSTLETPAQRSL
jgi:hypothetical protein